MGVRHVDLPQEGVQFHPGRSSPSTAPRWSRTSWSAMSTRRDPVAAFTEVAAGHPRCCLAGRRRRPRVVPPALDHRLARRGRRVADVRRRPPRGHPPRGRHQCRGRRRPFAVLEAELDAGSTVGPVVRLLRLRRPSRPPRRPTPTCPMRSGCGPRASGCSSTRGARRSPRSTGSALRPLQTRHEEPPRPPRTPRRSTSSRSTCTRATPTRSTSPTGSGIASDTDPRRRTSGCGA